MEDLYSIFPARREWPNAIDDVTKAAPDASAIRLVSQSQSFDALPSYENLKALWCFGVDERKLKRICECASLESLYIEDIKTENLECLASLSNLRVLGIETCPKVTSLLALGGLRSLSGLAITHFRNVHDLRPLANLGSLRALAVAGSMWTKMTVDTLQPLEELKSLELLHLANMEPEDGSLRPLAALQRLKRLDIANFYPTREFAWLSRKLKTTECTWFQPYIEMRHMECKKCKKVTMVMLTGKRKPTLCAVCSSSVLERHVRQWNELTPL